MRKFFTYADRIVPVHHPRVLVATAVEQGARRQALFEDTGITPEMLSNPDTRLSYFEFSLLARNALRLTGNRGLGLDVGANIGFPQMGPLGLAIMSSPTIGDALEAALRYNRLLAPAWEFGLRREGERAILSLREVLPLAPFHIFASDVVLAALDRQSRELAAGPLPIRSLRLAFPRPEHAARYLELYAVPILFDQSITEVEFDAAILSREVAFADPATALLAERLCAQLSFPETTAEGLVDQVRRLLVTARERPPGVEEIARALQTSTRSLRRSLREMGASYSELLDESRRLRAEELVRATPLTFEQIADRLGFGDVRSFRRAFKRWIGTTPGEYRVRQKPNDTSPALTGAARCSSQNLLQ